MHIDLKGRHAVVTGGASNIGRGITLALADAGAKVIILDRDLEQARRTAALRPGLISVCQCDLSDAAAIHAVMGDLLQTQPISILVNNAGWVRTENLVSKDLAELDFEIRVNLLAPLLLTRLVLPAMIGRRYGRIVSVASEAGRVGQRGQVAYSAAKGGVLGMTRSLAQEVGRDGITVNAVSPAMIVPDSAEDIGEKSMQQARNRPPELMARIVKAYPVGRVGRPRDIGAAVAFLASDEAEFITGQTLAVNGGFSTT